MDEACPKCGADDGISGKCAAMFVAKNAEIASLRAELTANNELYVIAQSGQNAEAIARLKEALEPFAKLNVTRFMTDGIRYSFRVDAAWIRGARAALACRPQQESHDPFRCEACRSDGYCSRPEGCLACRPQAVLQPLTADQKEYLQSIERTIGDYDPSAVIGRPQGEKP